MRFSKTLICVVVLLAGCGPSSPPVPPWNGKLTQKIPEPVRTALEVVQEFELLSLDPKHRDSDKPSEFLRRKVIGKTLVTDAETRKRILGALDAGVRPDRDLAGAACFDPRHAIRVQHAGQTFYIPICFECNNVYVFVDDQAKPLYFSISGLPEPVFDEVLRTAKVPLAEKAGLEVELVREPRRN